MQFLNEIREHLNNFETEATAEIHRFIDWLHTKYQPPGAPVVAPPVTSYVESAPTFIPASVDAVATSAPATVPVADNDPAPADDSPVEDAPIKRARKK